MHTAQIKEPSLFILQLLVSFASVAAVLFTPALPEITQKLSISQAQAQLTVTIFLIGYALGNLPYGPLANRFGRKPMLYAGSLLTALGSLMVVFVSSSQTFWLFLIGRFLMALGSSVGMKIAFTMIGDVYDQVQAAKKISYFMYSFALGPGFAIAIGGLLTHNYGWQSCFYFLIGYSILISILTSFLPETCLKKDTTALNFEKIREGYGQKFRNKKLTTCALMMGCMTSIVYLFAAEAPFIGIEKIGLSADTYGFLNFIPPVGMIIGSLLLNLLIKKREALSILRFGSLGSLCISLLMLSLFALEQVNAWSLFLPMPFIYIGLAFVFATASSMALAHAKNKSNGSAVLNFINMGITVIVLSVMEALPTREAYFMPCLFSLLAISVLFLRNHLIRLLKAET